MSFATGIQRGSKWGALECLEIGWRATKVRGVSDEHGIQYMRVKCLCGQEREITDDEMPQIRRTWLRSCGLNGCTAEGMGINPGRPKRLGPVGQNKSGKETVPGPGEGAPGQGQAVRIGLRDIARVIGGREEVIEKIRDGLMKAERGKEPITPQTVYMPLSLLGQIQEVAKETGWSKNRAMVVGLMIGMRAMKKEGEES